MGDPLPLITLNSFVIATYALLFLTVVFLWVRTKSPLWLGLLLVTVISGYLSGVVTAIAILPIALMALACWYYGQLTMSDAPQPVLKGIVATVVLIIAILLGFHLLPGFNNQTLVRNLVLSPGSAPYTQWLNFDKTIAGLLILGLCYRGLMTARREWMEALRRVAPIILINIAIVVGLAFMFGFVRFDPKWSAFFPLWAMVNLFFTCMSEEALFRGFIQRELDLRLQKYRFGRVVAIAVSAILFGLVHYAGGVTYVLLATVAGVGYALVFQRSGRIEMAILAHFVLNTMHFLLLTYPRAA